MAAALLLFPVIGVGAVLRPGRIGTDIGVGIMFAALGAAAISMSQMGLLSYRAGRTGRYLLERDAQAGSEPLTPYDAGWPTRYDFWVMLCIALAVSGILVFAGTRSPHSG